MATRTNLRIDQPEALFDIALTRQQEATDWLLDPIEKGHRHAADAHEALSRSARQGQPWTVSGNSVGHASGANPTLI